VSGSGTGIVTPYNTHRAIAGGVADGYVRGADLVGNADAPVGIASVWFRPDAGDGTNRVIFSNRNSRFFIWLGAANTIWVRGQTAAPAVILDLITTPTYLAGSGWHHLLASWDLAVPTASLWIDNVQPVLGTNTVLGGVVDYTRADWGYARRWNNTLSINGGVGGVPQCRRVCGCDG